MEFNSREPIYLQVIHQIKKEMLSGMRMAGDKLPSTRELSMEYKINPNTAARIYREMELMGLCHTKRGIGTFLTEDQNMYQALRDEMADETIENFITDMKGLGYKKQEAVDLIRKEWKE